MNGHLEVVEWLVDHGADLNSSDQVRLVLFDPSFTQCRME